MADRRLDSVASEDVGDELSYVVQALCDGEQLTELSALRATEIADRLGSFLGKGLGVASIREATADQVRSFVLADGTTGPPSVATMHVRRAMVRLLFRGARQLGLASIDPTLDLDLPVRSHGIARPLSALEIDLCRHASLYTLESTRLSTVWALAEATARTTEIPHLTVGDLDLREWTCLDPWRISNRAALGPLDDMGTRATRARTTGRHC